jgi:hypothetical protein
LQYPTPNKRTQHQNRIMATPIASQIGSNLAQPNPAPNWKVLTLPEPFQIVSWKTEPEPTLADDGGVKLADVEKGMRTLGEMGKEPHPLIWFARSVDITMSAASTTQAGPDVAALTDPKNLENPQAQLRALRELELNHQSSADFSAEQWQAMAAKYKALTKLTDTPGTVWTRDSTYNGFWAKGAQQAILKGKSIGREMLDQASGIAAESGAAAGVGVGAGVATAKSLKTGVVAGTVKNAPVVMGANDGPKPGASVGRQIANGHAFQKHVVVQGEFRNLNIQTPKQFAQQIEKIIDNPGTPKRNLSNGRTAYWDQTTGTVVVRNPGVSDGGTAFRPTNGRAYFDNLK